MSMRAAPGAILLINSSWKIATFAMRYKIVASVLTSFLVNLAGLCFSESFALTHVGVIKVGNAKRHYSLFVPKFPAARPGPDPKSGTASKKMPVVILLHGALSRPWCVDFDSNMRSYAQRQNFIAVYPCGTGIGPSGLLFWNAGACCGPAKEKAVDDVEFIRQLIAKLKRDYNADPTRIYVAGASNGGMMAYRLAVEMSDQIAAIGSVDGCMFPSNKKPTDPVSIIEFHGTADSVIPYEGGTGKWFFYKVHDVPSTADTIAYWVAHNNCSLAANKTDNKFVAREIYNGGDGNTAVSLVTTKAGKHMWPGGRGCVLTDRASTKVQCTKEMLEFFRQHPKTTENSKVSQP